MKSTTYKALLTGFFSWTLLSAASADPVYVRIGGAQAFGDAVHRALAHNLGAAAGNSTPYTVGAGAIYAYTGTDINKAQQSIWSGTINGVQVIIKTSFTGSTDGIRLVAKNVPVAFLDDSVLTAAPAASAGGKQLPTTGNLTELLVPDAAAVDTFQSSTVYTSNPPLQDAKVGAGAYLFVASKDAPASVGTYGQPLADAATAGANPTTRYYPGLTNITTQQAQSLYSVGNLPLAVFTGVASDRTTTFNPSFHTAGINYPAPLQVFATGRDYGSGARVVAFIETAIGGNANVTQYKPTVVSNVVTDQALYPEVTINGRFYPAGSDGNTSNGNLATTVLKASTQATLGGYYISYLPSLDAANAVAAGAHALAYNGVFYSPAAVSDGSYPIFAYEHILYRASATVDQKTVLQAFIDQLTNVDATLLISALKVSRPLDGALITPLY